MNSSRLLTWIGLCCWLIRIANSCLADSPSQATDQHVATLQVLPPEVDLTYIGDQQRLVLLVTNADGSTQDVTEQAQLVVADDQVVDLNRAIVRAKHSGQTDIDARWQGLAAQAKLIVSPEAAQRPLGFRNDVLPVLTRAGCNAGKCHGAASGKDGFRLSLYGFDPEGDHYRLTREMSGRRIDLSQPDQCLLINKATGEVPHTGGTCIEPGSPAYSTIVRWIATGAQADPEQTPVPVAIDVFPNNVVLSRPELTQQLVVVAKYSDGSARDVTSLSVFVSNNDAVATTDADGSITATGPGSGFVMARFDQFTSGSSIVVRSGQDYPGLKFTTLNYIDELTAQRWRDLHVLPSSLCDDDTFLRRVYLDTTGLLPTEEQRQQFLNDHSPGKRDRLIDALVQSQDFLDLWAMQLAELLQIRNANGLSSKGLQRYDAWLRGLVRSGVSVDQILRQLIPASGGTFENPATTYYQTETTPQLLAENMAQAFLGTRIQCAQCHNHPFDRWTMDDYYGFASFVSQVGYKQARDPREVTVYNAGEGSLQHPVPGRVVHPKFLGGDRFTANSDNDVREALAEWLTSPDNTAFSSNIANLLWAHFTGLGIVNPVDDMRVSNPPSNPELLNALGRRLVEYRYDVRRLASDICKSATYQLATQTTQWNAWDDRNFSHARVRRLRAEVLLDCINQVTMTSDTLAGLPLGGRAIQIPNGDSNNYFLTTFGRASRNTACSCEVSTAPTLSQALHLLNGENTTAKIVDGQWIEKQLSSGSSPRDVAAAIYVRCLTRLPTPSEMTEINSRLQVADDVKAELVDLFWAILNANEFIFNH